MRNEDVIKNYFNFNQAKSSNNNLWTRYNYNNEWELVNYSTPLVRYSNGVYYINTKKYSTTTSKIQTYINRYIENNFTSEIVETMEV